MTSRIWRAIEPSGAVTEIPTAELLSVGQASQGSGSGGAS